MFGVRQCGGGPAYRRGGIGLLRPADGADGAQGRRGGE